MPNFSSHPASQILFSLQKLIKLKVFHIDEGLFPLLSSYISLFSERRHMNTLTACKNTLCLKHRRHITKKNYITNCHLITSTYLLPVSKMFSSLLDHDKLFEIQNSFNSISWLNFFLSGCTMLFKMSSSIHCLASPQLLPQFRNL